LILTLKSDRAVKSPRIHRQEQASAQRWHLRSAWPRRPRWTPRSTWLAAAYATLAPRPYGNGNRRAAVGSFSAGCAGPMLSA
jgi:hypothetical protein